MKNALIFMLVTLIAGCSTSGTSIKIGEDRHYAPTSPDSISLLLEAPQKKHQIIALVEGVAATDDYFTKTRTEAAAIEVMKKEANRIGANAIVLTGKNSAPYGQVGFATTTGSAIAAGNYISGYASTVSSGFGWEKITFSGTAIRYVDKGE